MVGFFGGVGLDFGTGPSRILVVAGRGKDPAWIAADLLSQAEHDAASQSILITDDAGFADRVALAVEAHLARLPGAAIAGKSWSGTRGLITDGNLTGGAGLMRSSAPPEF